MKKDNIYLIFSRYIIILLLSIGNLFLFYFTFTPLTLYPVYYLLSLFYDTALSGTTILLESLPIEIIPACVAGAAYFFLIILNLSTPMNIRKRFYSIAYTLIAFLILNIIRIFIFSVLALNNFSYFDIAHAFTWYFGSTLLLLIIWFSNVKLFKIKEIPIYTDLRNLYLQTKPKGKKRRK